MVEMREVVRSPNAEGRFERDLREEGEKGRRRECECEWECDMLRGSRCGEGIRVGVLVVVVLDVLILMMG